MAKILVVGAGYAGIMTATGLDKISEPFTLVNNNSYHYFTTLLHEAAGGRGEPMNYTVPIQDLMKKSSSQFIEDEITGLDRARRVVIAKNSEYEYDYLVFTLGWVPEYFGIKGMAEHSLVIRNVESASHIRKHIEAQFRQYTEDHDETHLRIVVGGGGLTGIELVGELLDWIPELCVKYGIDRSLVDLQNIEAMPTILPQVSEQLREVAAKILTEKGAKLRTSTKLLSVEHERVYLDGDEVVSAGTIIWTGGVRANPILQEAGFTVDRRGRAKVNEFLQSVDDERIFVGGDCAWFEEDGNPLPPTAQIATQMGRTLAQNVSSIAHGQSLKAFHGSLKGTLASLGREVGVGNIGRVSVRGAIAGFAKEATKVKYLWELGGVGLTVDKTGQLLQRQS